MSSAADDLDANRGGAVPGAVYGALLHWIGARIACGALRVVRPDGLTVEQCTGQPGPRAVIELRRWRALRRLLTGGSIGFAEAYIDGDWTSPDPVAVLELAARNDERLAAATAGSLLRRCLDRLLHRLRGNTLAGSRRNIVAHYDLGNDFYALWLDPSMSYSAALYRKPEMSLEAAQAAKRTRVIELLDAAPGDAVLEIGCGWGSLAKDLAAGGSRVSALTLSPAQRDFAAARLREAGLTERVDLRLEDYRHVQGQFDRIVSIEMLEAVGEAYWPLFFDRLRALLRPQGTVVLQVITIANERFAAYRRRADFIQRHVFPGGMLPCPAALQREIAGAGFVIEQVETFGASYARTLAEWRARFHAASPAVAGLGFPPRFQRLWEYYLAYCEAGFRAGAIDVGLWRLRAP